MPCYPPLLWNCFVFFGFFFENSVSSIYVHLYLKAIFVAIALSSVQLGYEVALCLAECAVLFPKARENEEDDGGTLDSAVGSGSLAESTSLNVEVHSSDTSNATVCAFLGDSKQKKTPKCSIQSTFGLNCT